MLNDHRSCMALKYPPEGNEHSRMLEAPRRGAKAYSVKARRKELFGLAGAIKQALQFGGGGGGGAAGGFSARERNIVSESLPN